MSAPAPAGAQETGDAEEPDRWQVSAELSYTDQSGNNDLRLFTGGFNLTHLQPEQFELNSTLQSRYGKSEGELVARNYYGSLSFDFFPENTWSPFLFVDAERDPFKRLDLRASGGAGAKYTFYRPGGDVGSASVSLALLASHRNLTAVPEEPDPPSETVARWSLRLKGSREVGAGTTLTHVTFYQPVVDEMNDYLLRSESGVKVALSERLALSVVYQLDQTSITPPNVDRTERLFKTGIILDF